MMKRSTLLLLAGGLFAAIALFMPFPWNGLFGSGLGLLPAWQQAFQHFQVTNPIDLLLFLEPLGVLLMIAGAVFALKNGKVALPLGLSGAVLGLTLLVWSFSFFYEEYPSVAPGGSFGGFLQDFGVGYWLAVGGCLLGLVGALSSAREQPAPAGGRMSGIKPGMVLVLWGSLAAVAGFFLPLFSYSPVPMSAFDLITQPDGYLVFWPAPVAAILLLAGGLLAITKAQAVYLGGLSGALVGLSFLVLVLFLAAHHDGSVNVRLLGIGYWLTAGGALLGLVGAVRSLLGRMG
ncbi:MAG TPA: hypothetical protein VKT82_06335 [Ktedonobacterales bacterium]|nr:hypothetical protein [Ktedonobacterales bacterium]